MIPVRQAWLAATLSAGLALLAARSLTPPELPSAAWALDGGDLLTAVMSGGIPHPTGYPLTLWLGALAMQLPTGTPYERLAWLSAVPVAACAGILAGGLTLIVPGWRGWISGVLAGCAFAFSPLVLGQAAIVEVYGLALTGALAVGGWTVLIWRDSSPRRQAMFAVLSGLALVSHLSNLVFLPLVGIAFWRRRTNWPRLAGQVLMCAGTAAGLALTLALRPLPGAQVWWGDPHSFSGWWWLVSAQVYAPLSGHLDPAWLLNRLPWLGGQVFAAVGWPVCLLAVTGLIWLFRRDRQIACVTGLALLLNAWLAAGSRTNDAQVLLLPLVWVISALAGMGMAWAVQRTPGSLAVGVALLAWLISLPGTWLTLEQALSVSLEQPARQALAQAPTDAVILADADAQVFSLWTLRYAYGQRTDVDVLANGLLGYDWAQRQPAVQRMQRFGRPHCVLMEENWAMVCKPAGGMP